MLKIYRKLIFLLILLSLSYILCSCDRTPPKQLEKSPVATVTPVVATVSPLATTLSTNTPISSMQTPFPTVKPNELKISDYFPIEEKVFRKYKGIGNEFAEYQSYIDFVKNGALQERRITGGTTSVNVTKIINGQLVMVYSEGEMYKKEDFTGKTNMKRVLLSEPIKVGTTWKNDEDRVLTITAIDKKIKTPLGEYSCVEVSDIGVENVMKSYYAKNIGLVKTEYRDKKGEYVVTQELEELKKGVEWKENTNNK